MINIAILGFGKIGSGTAEFLEKNAAIIEEKTGERIRVKHIVDIKSFPDSPYADRVTADIERVISDPEVTIVAEMMGGSHPAYEYTMKALCAGKHVVTSNKEVVSRHGVEFLAAAAAHGVRYLFEASVGGGIPILRPMTEDLSGNEITEISGILNGTTNYILTQMFGNGKSFETALAEAQEKGYAELDPTDDIKGKDSCRKICILAAIAFGKLVAPENVSTVGIESITEDDVRHAEVCHASIKLLGHAKKNTDGSIFVTVEPFLVPNFSPLAHVDDVFNGILLHGEPVGDVFFYGPGAGKAPTASAVVSDIIDIVIHAPHPPRQKLWESAEPRDLCGTEHLESRFLISFPGQADAQGAAASFPGCRILASAGESGALVTEPLCENELSEKLLSLKARGIHPCSRIRVL